ncbi:MAG: cysteine desulfurase family protein [Methylobacter sp.]|nr:cysteine desulfurase family protein [Methylobacter sp.]MDP3055168.1 cysteine desulfurase family protein [Methylobacter sp.]MDP3363668.1 cysteine desulfurase family protein [Methylobacter sp.]
MGSLYFLRHLNPILNSHIYLDYAATTPMAPEAVTAMLQCLTGDGAFANPASLQHHFGERAHALIEDARADMAKSLGCKSSELIFTSGATESNNLAIKGIALRYQHKGRHIITSATEHKSILDCCKYLEGIGFQITYLRPDQQGQLSLDCILAALTEQTILVSLMQVNNETGVIQDIDRIAHALKDKDLFFHVDAAQSAGKLNINLANTPIDLLSLSGHKFYGPKGIGGLFVRNRKQTQLTPLLHGGGQEYGLRPGTLPTHQIIGMATAFRIADESMQEDYQHCQRLADILTAQLKQLDGVHFNGAPAHKLANIINVSFDQVGADALMIALRDEIAMASGSACNSGAIEASHVLRAMGIEGDRLYGAVRISFGRYNTEAEIKQAGQRMVEEVARLRQLTLE